MTTSPSAKTTAPINPLCEADVVLSGAQLSLRRIHRSVRAFFGIFQAFLALRDEGATGSWPSMSQVAGEFIGELSTDDLDVLTTADDTQRQAVVNLRKAHHELTAREEIELETMHQDLKRLLADRTLPPAAKAEAVTSAVQRRRELALKRLQRLQEIDRVEQPLRLAFFKWICGSSLEYADEGLGGPLGLRTTDADMTGTTEAAIETQHQHQYADVAAERSVHAMLAKSLSALQRSLAPESAAPLPPPEIDPFATIAGESARMLLQLANAWHDRPDKRADRHALSHNGVTDNPDAVGKRWRGVEQLLWPAGGAARVEKPNAAQVGGARGTVAVNQAPAAASSRPQMRQQSPLAEDDDATPEQKGATSSHGRGARVPRFAAIYSDPPQYRSRARKEDGSTAASVAVLGADETSGTAPQPSLVPSPRSGTSGTNREALLPSRRAVGSVPLEEQQSSLDDDPNIEHPTSSTEHRAPLCVRSQPALSHINEPGSTKDTSPTPAELARRGSQPLPTSAGTRPVSATLCPPLAAVESADAECRLQTPAEVAHGRVTQQLMILADRFPPLTHPLNRAQLEKDLVCSSWAAERAFALIRARASRPASVPLAAETPPAASKGGSTNAFSLSRQATAGAEEEAARSSSLRATREAQRRVARSRRVISKLRDREGETTAGSAQSYFLPPPRASGSRTPLNNEAEGSSVVPVEYARIATLGDTTHVGSVFGFFPLPKTNWKAAVRREKAPSDDATPGQIHQLGQGPPPPLLASVERAVVHRDGPRVMDLLRSERSPKP